MQQTLEGRTALVTGVTSGIGRALAGALVRGGAAVLGVGRHEGRLGAVAAELGAGLRPVLADLSVEADRTRAVAAGLEAGADVLVNNAAACVYEAPTGFGPERWRSLLEINLVAAAHLAGALGAEMSAGGQIINVSSVTTRHLAHPSFGPYAVTKAALEHYTRALRLELAGRGVAVSLVVPGLVDTPIYQKVEGFERKEAWLRKALPTWLEPEDVADAVVWMLTRPGRVVVSELVLLPRGQAR